MITGPDIVLSFSMLSLMPEDFPEGFVNACIGLSSNFGDFNSCGEHGLSSGTVKSLPNSGNFLMVLS